MASYNAAINIVVSGQQRLDYVLNSVEKLNAITAKLKPINLLAPGAGAGGDAIRGAKKQLDDFARAVVNFKPEGIQKRARELSNTMAGAADQAAALTTALANVGLKSGGFKEQAAEVKNYALALDTAARNAARLNAIGSTVQRGARVENIATRFNVTPEQVEQRLAGIREAAAKRQARLDEAERQRDVQKFIALKREEDFELRLGRILERNAAAKAKRTRQSEATSNAIIGGAFPLLFGQGIGASLGGGLGGAAGGALGGQLGFGLSLVGTALGSVFDQAILSAQDFSKSLRAGGDAATYLEQRLGSVNSEVKLQISNLQQSGQTSAAANKAFSELARQIGTENAQAFKTLGDETSSFSTGFQRLVTILIAGSTRINQALAPLLDRLVPGLEGIKTFIRGVSGFAPQTPQSAVTPEFAARTAELTRQNTILGLQVELTSVSAANDLERFVTIQKQIATKEYENELTKIAIRLKNNEIDLEQNKLQITAANLELSKKLGDIERNRVEELARRQQQAAQAAEQAQQKARQNLLAQISVENSIFTEQLKRVNLNVEQLEYLGGEKAALERSLTLFNTRVRISEELLSAERDKALIEARANGTVQQTLKLYETKRKNLQIELNLQNKLEARRLAQIKVEEQLAAARREQAIEDVALPIQRRQEEVRIGIASFGQTEQVTEQQRQNLEQRLRLQEAEAPILREITDLQRDINGGGLAEGALAAKEKDLDASQRKLGVLREELTLLDQLEQRQLRLQQFFASYGQLIQSVSGEIANAVTFGVSEMVRGTKTAEQVFADFLNAVGNALMQAAQTMIAQYIAIGIAKIFAGLGGGGLGSMGGGGGFGSFSGGSVGVGGMSLPGLEGAGALASASPFSYAGVVMRAGGGPAVGGTPYLVGERGPELFVPGTSGGVMSNNDLRQSMNGGGSPVLNMSFETTRFGDTEYVSRDQLEAAMSETRRQASRDGAQRGMTMTLDRLQQSPRTRSRLGMR